MIFFLAYSIKIHNESSAFEDVGSTARCWIKAPTLEAADSNVRKGLKKYNWEILLLQEGREVNENDYPQSTTERNSYNEAIAKEEFIMIDTKPKRKSLS